jgi:hypothetical protein
MYGIFYIFEWSIIYFKILFLFFSAKWWDYAVNVRIIIENEQKENALKGREVIM